MISDGSVATVGLAEADTSEKKAVGKMEVKTMTVERKTMRMGLRACYSTGGLIMTKEGD